MRGKSRHLLLTLALSALGAGLLLLLIRTGATDVQAAQSAERPVEERVAPIAAQAMYDLHPLFVDSYDGAYESTYRTARAITYTGSAPYAWGRVLSSATEFTNTLWSVGGGTGTALDPDTDFYPGGVNTSITYGPFSLRNAITVEVAFSHWVSTSVGETFEWGISTDGTTYAYTEVTHNSAGNWETTVLSSPSELNSLLDQDTVYLAFRFQSNGDAQTDRGVFLDNVQVRTTYDVKTYMPLIFRSWFQEYTYTENFEPPYQSPAWPYGYYYRSVSDSLGDGYALQELAPYEFESGDVFGIAAAVEFWYGYTQDADGSYVYYIAIADNFDHVFLTGPAYALGDNWEYQAYMRRATDKDPNLREYGLLISPTPINVKYPRADDVYTFHIRNWTPDTDGRWIVKKWDVYSSDDHPANEIEAGNTNRISETDHVWNILRIERRGNTLYFRIAKRDNPSDIVTVYQLTDPDLADQYYVGFFAANNEITSRRDWQFDNVYVHAAP